MTSSNSIEYTIYDLNNVEVGHHRQNIMCLTCNDNLMKFQPSKDYTIETWGYDEEEELWGDGTKENLEVWLSKHPPQFTMIKFNPDDNVMLNKKRGEGVIIETFKGMFFPTYTVRLLNGDVLENVQQNELLPIK